MADSDLVGLAGFTPVLTDIQYGVDDPGGTPVDGKHTYAVLRDLIQANLTKAALPDAGALTIASGVITITGSYHTVIVQSGSSDALDTINGGVDGNILILQADDTDKTINVTTAGNIKPSADPIALATSEDTIMLLFSGALSAWVELSSSLTNV